MRSLKSTPTGLAADGISWTRNRSYRRDVGAMPWNDALIEQKTGVSTLTVQDAMLVVAAGVGKQQIMSGNHGDVNRYEASGRLWWLGSEETAAGNSYR